jgi:hypothetical protein
MDCLLEEHNTAQGRSMIGMETSEHGRPQRAWELSSVLAATRIRRHFVVACVLQSVRCIT